MLIPMNQTKGGLGEDNSRTSSSFCLKRLVPPHFSLKTVRASLESVALQALLAFLSSPHTPPPLSALGATARLKSQQAAEGEV